MTRLGRWLRRSPELWLAVLAAAPYVVMALRGRMIILLDILAEHGPNQAIINRVLGEAPGRVPVWNPYLFCGCPLFADPQMQVCYPPALLFRLLPYPTALGWFLAAHIALAVAGAWAFLRALKLDIPGAALGAAAYALSGQMWISAATPVCLTAMAWIPWAGWGALRVARRPGMADGLVLAMILAWMALVGHPQFVMYAAVLMVAAWWTGGGTKAGAAWIGGAAMWGVAVDAIQMLPTAAYLPWTGRFEPLTEAAGAVDALHPSHLLSYLLPWTIAVIPRGFTLDIRELWPTFNFVGSLPLALAVIAVATLWTDRQVRIAVSLAAVALLLAMGSGAPAIGSAVSALSFSAWFRRSAYWMCLANLAMGWLAATALERFTRGRGSRSARGIAAWAMVGATFVELLIVGVLLQPAIPATWIMTPGPAETRLVGRLGYAGRWGRVATAGSRLRAGIQEGQDLRDSASRVRAALRPNLPAAAGLRQIDGVGPLFPARVLEARRILEGGDPAAASALFNRLGAAVTLSYTSQEGAAETSRSRAAKPVRVSEGNTSLRLLAATSGRWEVAVDSDRPLSLLVAETWLPGWRARDEQGREMITSPDGDGLVTLTSDRGARRILVWFDQPGLRVGAWISFLTLAAILAGMVLARRPDAPAGPAQNPRRARPPR